MRATIITIGDEILIGQIVDTNSASISRKLNAAGITIASKLSIGDTAEAITEAVERPIAECDITIITGGLGPTKDDITKHPLAEIFNSELVYNEAEGEHVRTLLERRGIAFTDLNRGQAMLPHAAPYCTMPMAQPQACGSTHPQVAWWYRYRAYHSRWSTLWTMR